MNRADLQLRTARASAHLADLRPKQRLPEHCRAHVRASPRVAAMQRMLRELELVTVCEEARCPNRNQCFSEGTASFMLLGAVCTRTCRFCNVATGKPGALEPTRVAAAIARLDLRCARGLGFRHVASGPPVRSSFKAGDLRPLLEPRGDHVAF